MTLAELIEKRHAAQREINESPEFRQGTKWLKDRERAVFAMDRQIARFPTPSVPLGWDVID